MARGPRRGAARVFTALAFATLLAGAGCRGSLRMYEGPTRPMEELAVILPVPYDLYLFDVFQVEIISVDDRVLGLANRTAIVLPGIHRVKLRRGSGIGRKHEEEFSFDAKAGHVYEADAADLEGDPPRVTMWIVDSADQSVVAGTPPPPKPPEK